MTGSVRVIKGERVPQVLQYQPAWYISLYASLLCFINTSGNSTRDSSMNI